MPIAAVVMQPPGGASSAERWLAQGRSAAAEDLVRRLGESGAYDPILLLAAETGDRQRLAQVGATPVEYSQAEFHFGRMLAELVRSWGLTRLAYFGGASAPLLESDALGQLAAQLEAAAGRRAIVNNLRSTDWALIQGAGAVTALAERLPSDNALGWVLEHEAGFELQAPPACAATRLDLDTPIDLLVLEGHAGLGPSLRDHLGTIDSDLLQPISSVRAILGRVDSRVTLIGRVAAQAWVELEKHTRTWVRVFSEERGMQASGRWQQGLVHSLVQRHLDQVGPTAFIQELQHLSDAVLWDNRVWMAARPAWPSAADRFASDLGWADQVEDPDLRTLTRAVSESEIPILVGGHGLVSGGIYALLEGPGDG